VLHFVDRNPGLTVAELLDILNITKQSLGRVLKELVEQGFVIQREGPHDRRRRLLATTARGHRLAFSLATLQSDRVRAALAQTGPAGHAAAACFLFGLVDPRGRATVQRLVRGGAGQEER
jgi:DNA-binding MarR family transcriptional regulator